MWSKWLRFDNDNSFNWGTDEKPRTIRGTIRLGSKIDIQKLVTMCQTDLTLESDINFHYKDLQAWKTVQTIALVCGDNKIPAEHSAIMMRKLYTNSESRFMTRYPDRFPGGTFGGELPNFIVKCDWAQGTNCLERSEETKQGRHNAPKTPANSDEDRRLRADDRTDERNKEEGKRQKCLRRTHIPCNSTE